MFHVADCFSHSVSHERLPRRQLLNRQKHKSEREPLSLPTYQRSLPGADAHAVGGAGRELGPVGELTVVLAGQLTSLGDGGHGLGGFQALVDVGLRPVQLATRHGWKNWTQRQIKQASLERVDDVRRFTFFFYCFNKLFVPAGLKMCRTIIHSREGRTFANSGAFIHCDNLIFTLLLVQPLTGMFYNTAAV